MPFLWQRLCVLIYWKVRKMKKAIFNILAFTVIMLLCWEITLAEPIKEERSAFAEEFITRLVKTLGLENILPDNPSINDYISILESEGIIPKGSYRPGSTLTRKERAVILNQALTPCYQEGSRPINTRRPIYLNQRITSTKVSGHVKVKFITEGKWREVKEGMNLNGNDTLWIAQDSSITIRFGDISIINVGAGVKGSVNDLIKPKKEDIISYIERYIIPSIEIPDCGSNIQNVYRPAFAGGVRG